MKSLSENGLKAVLGSDSPVESHDWRDGVYTTIIKRIHFQRKIRGCILSLASKLIGIALALGGHEDRYEYNSPAVRLQSGNRNSREIGLRNLSPTVNDRSTALSKPGRRVLSTPTLHGLKGIKISKARKRLAN